MAQVPIFKTMEELETYYYSRANMDLLKVDAPMLTSTAGVYSALYGAKVWAQLNQEANAWAILPKKPWDRSGFRVITARATTKPEGGVAENAAIPDSKKPTFLALSHGAKTVAHVFEASEVSQVLGPIDDGIDPMAVAREDFALEHVENLNKMLLTTVHTVAGNNVESIDRICSSYSEKANCGLDLNDADIYSQDRDTAASWVDAYVDHNSNTTRDFTTSLLDTAIRTIYTNSGKRPNVILTGEDTLERIVQSEQAKQRYVGEAEVKIGVNGIQSGPQGAGGISAGLNVATYRGIPIVTSQDAVQDTLSRVYFLNTEHLWIMVLKPTQYFEYGISKDQPFGTGKFGDKGLYRTCCELRCNFFAAQGKIRDLK